MSGEAMTAERVRAIRERIEADGPADTHCVWCGEDTEDGANGPCDPIKGGDPCERSPGDECQEDRGELFAEVERLLAAFATVTAERDQARDALRCTLGYPHRKPGQP